MDISLKKRDYGFDNLKLLLIITVVFGHIIEGFSLEGFWGLIRALIYSFHMPAFVFTAGYFASRSSKNISDSVVKCLVPFFIFNTLFLLFLPHSGRINIFTPRYAFWFLLSLFFWRIIAKPLSYIRGIVIISFAAGLLAGLYNSFAGFLSLSRTVCFLPFFLTGYKTDESVIKKLRGINKIIPAAVLLACAAVTAALYLSGTVPVRMYEMLSSYSAFKLTALKGICLRACMYILASCVIFAVICIVPDRQYRLSPVGSITICIYIFSSFAIKIMFNILHRFSLPLFENLYFQAAFAVIMTAAIIAATGNRFVFRAYNSASDFLKRLIIKSE